VLFAVLCSPSLLWADLEEPLIQVGQIAQPPAIDGNLDDPTWKMGSQLAHFPVWTLRTYAEEPLEVHLGYDQQSLYFAFRCFVQNQRELETLPRRGERDSFLWGRPYVRLQLRKATWSVWIMIDPRGTLADARNEDQGWNGNWVYETQLDSKGWSVEGRIAFSDLDQPVPTVGEQWQLEVQNDAVSWGGTVAFAGDRALLCLPDPWPAPVPGENRLPIKTALSGGLPKTILAEIELLPFEGEPRYVNQQGQGPASNLELAVRRPPLKFQHRINLVPPDSMATDLAYRLPQEGSYYATLSVRDQGSGELLYRSRGYWFKLSPNRDWLERLVLRLGETRSELDRYPANLRTTLQAEGDRLEARLTELRGALEPAWKNRQWNELADQLSTIEGDLDRYHHRVRYAFLRGSSSASVKFGVSAIHSLLKLQRDAVLPEPVRTEIALSAARNERESFQIVILPFGEDLHDIRVEAEALVGPGGAKIPKEAVEISLVEYVKIDWDSAYETDRRGWWPDPLVPLSEPFQVSGEHSCQPLWVTVHVPAGTPAGDYRGSISVKPINAEQTSIAVKLRVWDFELPREGHLKTHTWDSIEPFARFYNLKEYPVDWYLRICDLLLKNHLNPGFAGVNYTRTEPGRDGSYNFQTVEGVLQYCIEQGLTRFSVLQMRKGRYNEEESRQIYAFIKAYADFLRNKGWLDRALVELWDEPLLQEWPDVKARAERIRQLAPDLKLQLFANLSEGPYAFWTEEAKRHGSDRLIDIWAPIPPIEAPDLQARGGEIWTYFCTLARGVAPNFYIDRPAVYQRTIGWHCWMYHVDGFEHWSVDSFERNTHPGKPLSEKWPHIAWDPRSIGAFSGEGQLIYPGAEGQPLPSLRLEIFRDSMDDYEYLYRLRELANNARGQLDPADLARIRQLLAPEQYLLIKYPREVKTTLEDTIRFPDQPERFLEARTALAQAIEWLQSGLRK
jgi:hypothetical protein